MIVELAMDKYYSSILKKSIRLNKRIHFFSSDILYIYFFPLHFLFFKWKCNSPWTHFTPANKGTKTSSRLSWPGVWPAVVPPTRTTFLQRAAHFLRREAAPFLLLQGAESKDRVRSERWLWISHTCRVKQVTERKQLSQTLFQVYSALWWRCCAYLKVIITKT